MVEKPTSCILALISGKRLMNLTYVDSSKPRVAGLHRWNLECNNWNCTIGLKKKTVVFLINHVNYVLNIYVE